jgi:microcystin-dependent protein
MSLVEAYAGEIRLFTSGFAPRGWALCDGRLLPIEEYPVLFALIGTTYGGDGSTTFALPDMPGSLPPGADAERALGMGSQSDDVASDADVRSGPVPPINYIICLQGVYPDRA